MSFVEMIAVDYSPYANTHVVVFGNVYGLFVDISRPQNESNSGSEKPYDKKPGV